MIIKNTSKISTDTLKPLLKFASYGVRDAGVEVHIKNSGRSCFSGVAYGSAHRVWYIPTEEGGVRRVKMNCRPSSRSLITLKIPEGRRRYNIKEYGYWCKLKRFQLAYPDGFPLETWADEFIELAAHEFRHIWQFDRIKKGKGEYDAEMHALRILNKWRIHTGRHPIEKAKQPNPFAK